VGPPALIARLSNHVWKRVQVWYVISV
jgi:hypothetical protein